MNNEVGWDTTQPLVWGYYFYDRDREKLKSFGLKLQSEGFRSIKLTESANNPNKYLLYVSKEIIHTPLSLFNQNKKLARLAVENSIEVFDGWEAGKEPAL